MDRGIVSTVYADRLIIGIPDDMFKETIDNDRNMEIDVSVIEGLISDVKKNGLLEDIKKVCLMTQSKFIRMTEDESPSIESLLFDFLLKDEK